MLTEVNANNENLKGQRLSNGDYYLLRDGDEYFNLQPAWNWDLLPGVTWAQGAGTIERRPFSGSVGDAFSGATAMDTAFGAKNDIKLAARKFWACHGDVVVALIGDLRGANGGANTQEPVRTALDQALLRGPVTVSDPTGTRNLAADTFALQARWIYHHGLGYIPLGGLPITLQTGPVTGAWADINKSGSPLPITQPIFTPILQHGVRPDGQNSGYVLLGASNAAQVAEMVAKPTWQVLRNDGKCQAVRFSDGTPMVAFWEAGSLLDGEKTLLTVDKPCLLMASKGQLRVSDPAQVGGVINVILGSGETVALTLPSGGETSAPAVN